MSIESAIKAIHAAGLSDTNGEKILSNDQLRQIVELALTHGPSEQDARDAARYRHIRDMDPDADGPACHIVETGMNSWGKPYFEFLTGDEADSCIDQSIQEDSEENA